jgi:hypothetical protein
VTCELYREIREFEKTPDQFFKTTAIDHSATSPYLDRRGPLHPAQLTALRSHFAARSAPFAPAETKCIFQSNRSGVTELWSIVVFCRVDRRAAARPQV